MPLAPTVATQLTTPPTAPAFSLWVEGLDVIRDPGGSGFGTPIESVSVELAAPGNVSGMTWSVDDPGKAWTPRAGDRVLLYDHVRGRPVFGGFLKVPTSVGALGTARQWLLEAWGNEVVLDWSILTTDLVFASGTLMKDAVQAICGAARWGAPGVNWTSSPTALATPTQAQPVGDFGGSIIAFGSTLTIAAGSTVRAALRKVGDAFRQLFNTDGYFVPMFTVDPWMGLRAYVMAPAGTGTQGTAFMYDGQADWSTLTVTATPSAGNVPADLEHTHDGGVILRGQYIAGTGTSGLTMDGTGRPGALEYVSDAAITGEQQRILTATSRIITRAAVYRGSFRLEAYTPTPLTPPGTLVAITDAQTGATGTYYLGGVTITFAPDGTQEWEVAYGADPPSEITVSAWLQS